MIYNIEGKVQLFTDDGINIDTSNLMRGIFYTDNFCISRC